MRLNEAAIAKLGKLFPMLSSSRDEEVAATARAIIRVLEKNGSSIHEMGEHLTPSQVIKVVYKDKIVYREKVVYRDPPEAVEPSAPPEMHECDKDEVKRCAEHMLASGDLNDRERMFAEHMLKEASRPRAKMRMTWKQYHWWRSMMEDFGLNQQEQSEASA